MRYVIFLLMVSIPCIAGATISVPVSHVETGIAQQTKPHGFAPKKQRFFDRVAKNLLQKRLKKALGRSVDGAEKPLSILGFICTAVGVISLFSGAIGSLVLLLGGLVLGILGLALSSGATKRWVKGMAVAAIVPPIIVLILLLCWLSSVSSS